MSRSGELESVSFGRLLRFLKDLVGTRSAATAGLNRLDDRRDDFDECSPVESRCPIRARGTITAPMAWGSSIGLKIIMAVTGVILSGFVLGHMAGNLQVFQGQKAIDDYAKLLRAEPALLWTARPGPARRRWGCTSGPAWCSGVNQQARPDGLPQATTYRESSFASRSMRLTGPLLLAFIIYHILHMTTGTVHPSFQEGGVYHNLVTALQGGTGGDHLPAGDGGAGVPSLARRLEPVPDPGGRAGPVPVARAADRDGFHPGGRAGVHRRPPGDPDRVRQVMRGALPWN